MLKLPGPLLKILRERCALLFVQRQVLKARRNMGGDAVGQAQNVTAPDVECERKERMAA